MSDTGKQNPLGVNILGSVLLNEGLQINPVVTEHVGVSKTYSGHSPGTLVTETVLRLITYSINDAYNRGLVFQTPAGTSIYDQLIDTGGNLIPALGNAKAPTYIKIDPSGRWAYPTYTAPGSNDGVNPLSGYERGAVNTGDSTSEVFQNRYWIPYNTINPSKAVTQWGYIRLFALQAWYEFDWNGEPESDNTVQYKDYVQSYLTAASFVEYSNKAIMSMENSKTFLEGTYSNMNDLISADVTGVNLSTGSFGQDLIALGKVINVQDMQKFGLPSVLLRTIYRYNALTPSLTLALLSAGLTSVEVDDISSGKQETVTKEQEQKIYGAYLIIVGQDLIDILIPLNCKTQGLTSLADLLDIKKLFPNSYRSMTVPIYNASPGPTNSKTYYPIYEGEEISSRITAPAIEEQVGTIVLPEPPAITEPITEAQIETNLEEVLITDNIQADAEDYLARTAVVVPEIITYEPVVTPPVPKKTKEFGDRYQNPWDQQF